MSWLDKGKGGESRSHGSDRPIATCRVLREIPTVGLAVQTSHVEETCCHGEGVPKVALGFVHRFTWFGWKSDGGWMCEDCLGESDGWSPLSEIVWLDLELRDRIGAEYAEVRDRYIHERPCWDEGQWFSQFLSDRTRARLEGA